jgi:hypothetical protein
MHAMPDDDVPVVEVTGDKLPVEVDVTVKGVRVRVRVTVSLTKKRSDETPDAAQPEDQRLPTEQHE